MAIFPMRLCMISIRRNLVIIYSLLAICCVSVFISILLYKWTELSALDCFNKLSSEPHTTTSTTTTTHFKLAAPELINAVPLISDEIISKHYMSKADLRLKALHEKVERISQKVRKSDTIQLTEHAYSNATSQPNYNIHIFYYAWYGNLDYEKRWRHWNHEYLANWKQEDRKNYPTGTHQPPTDIGSNFYPALGCYSSRDPAIINTHMKQLYDARVGVLVVSWYPPGMADDEGESHDAMLTLLLDAAHRYKLKVAPHIEPYNNRNPINFAEHLRYFVTQYGEHPALYRMDRDGKTLPVFYVYDSYLTPAVAWKELLSTKGNLSVRGSKYDGIFLGLVVDMQHRYDIKKGHFDGFYTYFATNGFTYGSSWKNWRGLGKFARQNALLFVPSVGPGYIDTQVRPWNVANTRHRRHGKYYEVGWRSALAARARVVAITSFNEWHEGTQIEPAVAKTIPAFTYLDYEPEGPSFYMNLTKWWVSEFSRKQQEL